MSYRKSLFEGTPKKNVQKSRFNLSHEYKAQITSGHLTPILLLEYMPGDEWEIRSEFMFRAQSMYYPAMAMITMRADVYAIDYRILWPYQGEENQGWEKWIAEVTEEQHPTLDLWMKADLTATNANHLIHAYFGLPTSNHATNYHIPQVNAFPFSAYIKIYDEYYSVRQLEDPRWFPLQGGDNTAAFDTAWGAIESGAYGTISGLWEKDYLTSALPEPQIGEAVQVPLVADPEDPTTWPTNWVKADGNPVTTDEDLKTDGGAGGGKTYAEPGGVPTTLYLDTQTNASIIKQLRVAEVLQSYYERLMKVGQRYSDYIEGFFGKKPYPQYIDQPVMIGSMFGRVQISDTMTTAETVVGATAVQTGSYRGNANLYANEQDTIRYQCLNHGLIMCIMHVSPNTSYGQGVHRMWRRTVQADYPLDMFSSIGDQEILKEEVLFDFTPLNLNNEATFGYIPRHSEMKYMNNIHVGVLNFGTNKSQHFGRIWDLATTNFDDIEISVPFVHTTTAINGGIRETDVFRVLPLSTSGNTPAQHTYFCHIFHSIYVNRALPYYSTPDLT